MLSFSVAVNDRRKNAAGDWEDVPNYIDCNLFGTRAESLIKYLSKGSKVGVDGKLRWSQWEKDGQKRSKVDVTVDNIELLSPRPSGSTYHDPLDVPLDASLGAPLGAAASLGAPLVPEADKIPAAPEITVYDEDIPF